MNLVYTYRTDGTLNFIKLKIKGAASYFKWWEMMLIIQIVVVEDYVSILFPAFSVLGSQSNSCQFVP